MTPQPGRSAPCERGPYETLETAYAAVEEWVSRHDRQAGGPFWEVCFTDPNEVTDPAQWRTEVIQPLAG